MCHVFRQDTIVCPCDHESLHQMVGVALAHHQAGRFSVAKRIYLQILATNPCHADSHHLLGMIEFQAGHLESAADSICQAIAINPNGISYYAELGTVHQAQGKLNSAVALYRQTLVLKPTLSEVHVNLGVCVPHSKCADTSHCPADLLWVDGIQNKASLGNSHSV